jgi:hypothetical protein
LVAPESITKAAKEQLDEFYDWRKSFIEFILDCDDIHFTRANQLANVVLGDPNQQERSSG